MTKQGVLLVNLGSPDSTDVADVRRYLREFLLDERVLDNPAPVRHAIVNLFILPFRPRASAEAYQEIWTEDGSPLIHITGQVQQLLGDRLDIPVEIGMRYGNPSTTAGLERLRSRGVDEVFVIPLYPHYAMSSYETAVAKVRADCEAMGARMELTFQPPYYDDPDYVDALVESARPYLEDADYDHVLFSYHGIPERHVRKTDPSGVHCLAVENCCRKDHPAHGFCYRHQCHATTWAFVDKMGIAEDEWSISFQSRLLKDPWLRPYTDFELERFPSEGKKRIVVLSPAFVADCLETLEELGIRGREDFLAAGGKEYTLVPCLNDHPRWIDTLEKFVGRWQDGALVDDHPEINRPELPAAER